MNRKNFIRNTAMAAASLPLLPQWFEAGPKLNEPTPTPKLYLPQINELRKIVNTLPGTFPSKINVTKVADTIRPGDVVVKGEDPGKKYTLARTVYQFVYPDGHIMLDSGMDLETHKTFGKTEEPYYTENFEQVNMALNSAKMIILSHYHADHCAGIIRHENFNEIAHKVWVTTETANLLVEHPHKPTVKTSWEKVNRFIITDFEKCYPIAPGIAVFKTPGHTPDSKMLYIQLQDGTEFIHTVDSGWCMENITEERMKNASWVHENQELLLKQYKWINGIIKLFPKIIILCTHDNEQYNEFHKKQILGNGLIA